MSKLILIRHGQSTYNEKNLFTGWADVDLTEKGINEAKDSKYALSKLEGENLVLKNFPLATILRPSVVYSVDDNFSTNFMTLLNWLPIFPLYYEGKTKFTPIHCSDLTDTIQYVIINNVSS